MVQLRFTNLTSTYAEFYTTVFYYAKINVNAEEIKITNILKT